ncbi:MAG: hypothetical protein IKY90_10320 [Oscillospiraceae bacterium]|nr:hypothetical protein [Oscillospiraceae bacterium]
MKKNPYIAPITVAVLVVLYFIFYGYMATVVDDMPSVARVVFMAIPVVMIIVMIYTLIERIKEIRKGENDDLGKY